MGIYYDLFLEGRVENEWRCLSPSFINVNGDWKVAPILSGQSAIGAMLQDIGCWHSMPDDLSEQVKRVLWKKEDSEGKKTNEIDERYVQWFPLSDVECDPSRFEHEAYVTRESANAFDLGELEEIWNWLTPEEYGALPANEKQAYVYYRWTQPYGIYDFKCRLKTLASELALMYEESILLHEEGYRHVGEKRIIVRFG